MCSAKVKEKENKGRKMEKILTTLAEERGKSQISAENKEFGKENNRNLIDRAK